MDDIDFFAANLQVAYSVLDYAKGFTKGIFYVVRDMDAGLCRLIFHFPSTYMGIKEAIINYHDTYHKLIDAAIGIYQSSANWNAEQWGEYHSMVIGQILPLLTGVGAASGPAMAARFGEGITQSAEVVEGFLDTSRAIGWDANTFAEMAKGSFILERFGPMQPGPLHFTSAGPLSTVADTFRSSSYFQVISEEPIKLYRVYSENINALGAYWSRMKPTGPFQAQLDAALDPNWGNKATNWVEITVPKGVQFYEGAASDVALKAHNSNATTGSLLGGGNQVYYKNPLPHG